jgi:hypothetical protein
MPLFPSSGVGRPQMGLGVDVVQHAGADRQPTVEGVQRIGLGMWSMAWTTRMASSRTMSSPSEAGECRDVRTRGPGRTEFEGSPEPAPHNVGVIGRGVFS